MSPRKIEPRYGCEVFLNTKGKICIEQKSRSQGDSLIVLHPEEALGLIEGLKSVHEEALDFVPEPDDEEEKS